MPIKTVFVIHTFICVSTIDSTGWDAPENERHRMGNEPDNYKSRLLLISRDYIIVAIAMTFSVKLDVKLVTPSFRSDRP